MRQAAEGDEPEETSQKRDTVLCGEAAVHSITEYDNINIFQSLCWCFWLFQCLQVLPLLPLRSKQVGAGTLTTPMYYLEQIGDLLRIGLLEGVSRSLMITARYPCPP